MVHARLYCSSLTESTKSSGVETTFVLQLCDENNQTCYARFYENIIKTKLLGELS